jgi:hypothetical protein
MVFYLVVGIMQAQLQSDIPFCAFNGGNDVFVDVGNKSLGLEALMTYLQCDPVGTPSGFPQTCV